MTPEEKQRLLIEIDARHEKRKATMRSDGGAAWSPIEAHADVGRLLSLVKEQEASCGITIERWLKAPMGDGVYWWRADEADSDPDIHFVQGEFFYQVGFASSEIVANFGGEWLGPITPNSVAQMRSACVEKMRRKAGQSETTAFHISDPGAKSKLHIEANILYEAAKELESLSIEKQEGSL